MKLTFATRTPLIRSLVVGMAVGVLVAGAACDDTSDHASRAPDESAGGEGGALGGSANADCDAGRWDHDLDPATDCIAHVACSDDALRPGTASTDTVCRPETDPLVAGSAHTCVLLDGSAYCWGENHHFRITRGSASVRVEPALWFGIEDAVSLASGDRHACALRAGGVVSCAGWNADGELGGEVTTSSALVTVDVGSASEVVAVRAGHRHTCAVLADGTVSCWGAIYDGPPGDLAARQEPEIVAELNDVADVAAGWGHTCALLADRTVWCWGANSNGELGDGTEVDREVPVRVVGVTGVRSLTAGSHHTCALLLDGTVQCWGAFELPESDDEPREWHLVPVPVDNLTNVEAIEAASNSTCALLANGTARCWGWNGEGQLGDGTFNNVRVEPVAVVGLEGAVDLALGWAHGCGLLTSGTIECWGENAFGQLGDWTTGSLDAAVVARGIDGVEAVSAGGSHTCALSSEGEVECWGDNAYGQLGDGTRVGRFSSAKVTLPDSAQALDAALDYTCALLADETVWCWGDNASGQLGDGALVERSRPVTVSGLTTAIQVTTGDSHACALLADATVSCWGANTFGQLGDGTTEDHSTPASVPGLTNVTAVSAGRFHTCALLKDETVSCWGRDSHGQLGNGAPTGDVLTPQAVSGLDNVASLDVAALRSCALVTGGVVRCWGENGVYNDPEAGEDDPTEWDSPTNVSGLVSATEIGAGAAYVCARLPDGTVNCQGDGISTVDGLADVEHVTVGFDHGCGLRLDGTVACWGAYTRGQLADGVLRTVIFP